MTLIPDRQEKRQLVPVPIWGLNTVDDDSQMNPLFATEMSNAMIDDFRGVNKRSGMTLFNRASSMLPITQTGVISSITNQSVSGATGVVWSGVVTAGLRFRMASGTNVYTISGLVSNANISLTTDFTDTINTGSYTISPPGVFGLGVFVNSAGTTQKLVAFGGGTFFDLGSDTTGNATNVSPGIASILTNDTRFDTQVFKGDLYFCNGKQFQSWDGTNIAAVGGSPDPSDPKYVNLYTIGNANFLVIFGSTTTGKKSQGAFSDVNAPATWPADNIFQAGQDDGGEATGIAKINGGMMFFKSNGIFVMGGIPGANMSLRKASNIGCPCPHTIVEYQGQVIFVGTSGGQLNVFRYTGGNTFIKLADSIETTLNSDLKDSTKANWCGEVFNNKYYMSVTSSSGTFNDKHFVCYVDRPFRLEDGRLMFPWMEGDRGFNFLKTVTISGTPHLFSGSSTSGFIYEEENGTTDETTDNIFGNTAAIDARVASKNFDLGRPDIQKELLRAHTNLTALGSFNVNLEYILDFPSVGFTTKEINISKDTSLWSEVIFLQTPWQTASDKKLNEILFGWPTIAMYYKFRFANANASEPFTVFPMTIIYKEEAR